MQASLVLSIVDAQTAEEVVYANMVGSNVDAKTAEEVVYANMVGSNVDAQTAEEVVYANTVLFDEDEENFYWSLDENSRECISTFKHRCRRCYLKGCYYVINNNCFDNAEYWQDYNST